MSDRLLASVIELERTLQEEVRQEELRAASWQERESAALAAELEETRRELERRHVEQTEATRCRAEAEGEALQAAGAARCSRLSALSEAFLEELLRRQLDLLLPEVGDDHPHGEG